MNSEAEALFERRAAALKRLGLKASVMECAGCRARFIDPKPLGGRAWALVVADRDGRVYPGTPRRLCCSEACATTVLNKHRGKHSAWIEGYEPPEKKGGNRR